MSEAWVLVFYVVYGFSHASAGLTTIEGFSNRQACVDTALQIEQAWSIKWVCVSKGNKP